MFSKKGLSDIVTNVLIILLVLVAIGVVWAFVRPSLDSISGVENAGSLYGVVLSIEPESIVVNSAQSTVTLRVSRNSNDAAFAGVNVVLADAGGNQRAFIDRTVFGPLESRTITVNYAGSGLGTPVSVAVAAVIGANGKEQVGSVTDTRQITSSGGNPTGPVCGNGNVESGETCDDGNTISETSCTNYGGSGNYCNSVCSAAITFSPLTCPRCGDGTVQSANGEQCENSLCNYGPGNLQGDVAGSCSSTCRLGGGSICRCYADFTNDGLLNNADVTYSEQIVGGSPNMPLNGANPDCDGDGDIYGSGDIECVQTYVSAQQCGAWR